jgi:hypothetical protein
MKILLALALALLVPALPILARDTRSVEQLQRDLIGQTTGGREKTWRWSNVNQFVSSRLIAVEGNVITAECVLRASPEYFDRWLVRLRVTYEGNKVKHTGLLYIEKL